MSRTLLLSFAVAIAFTPANGQSTVPPYRFIYRPDIRIDSTAKIIRDLGAVVRQSPAIDDMKAALRDLLAAQEAYFSTHDSYTTDSNALDIFLTTHGQARTTVTFASRESWTGTATEPSLKGKNCVIYMGALRDLPNGAPKTLGGVVAKGAGDPVCDAP
jgi:hypothetical protein